MRSASARFICERALTSEYRLGNLTGVLGVIGPTRMPYEKVAAIVGYTSNLMTELASVPGETNA